MHVQVSGGIDNRCDQTIEQDMLQSTTNFYGTSRSTYTYPKRYQLMMALDSKKTR